MPKSDEKELRPTAGVRVDARPAKPGNLPVLCQGGFLMQRCAVFPRSILACLVLGVLLDGAALRAAEPSSVPYEELLPGAPSSHPPDLLAIPDLPRNRELSPPAPLPKEK